MLKSVDQGLAAQRGGTGVALLDHRGHFPALSLQGEDFPLSQLLRNGVEALTVL